MVILGAESISLRDGRTLIILAERTFEETGSPDGVQVLRVERLVARIVPGRLHLALFRRRSVGLVRLGGPQDGRDQVLGPGEKNDSVEHVAHVNAIPVD